MGSVILAIYSFSGGAPPHRGYWNTTVLSIGMASIKKPYNSCLMEITRIPADQFGAWKIVDSNTKNWNDLIEITGKTEIEEDDIIAIRKDMPPGHVD